MFDICPVGATDINFTSEQYFILSLSLQLKSQVLKQ